MKRLIRMKRKAIYKYSCWMLRLSVFVLRASGGSYALVHRPLESNGFTNTWRIVYESDFDGSQDELGCVSHEIHKFQDEYFPQ